VDLHVDRTNPTPIYRQIVREIKGLILSGALPPGFKLPPERRLARALGVNRTTVVTAYRDLKADGLVDGHVGRGTEVVHRRSAPPPAAAVEPVPWQQLVPEEPRAARDPLVRDLLELSERRDLITLSVGLPAPELLPLAAFGDVHAALLREIGAATLLHSPTEGVTALREAIAEMAPARGIECSPEEVLITSGSQQGLDLVSRVFVAPGDVVVVEEPSFFGALQVFRMAQARLVAVPVDENGMRTDLLEAVLERQRARLIYTLPTFQNPSGAVLSAGRRRHLLELAYRFQVPVLEDDPYSDLRYEGEPLPSLASMDRHGYVIYLSSFSKVLFPGLRLGFLVAPRGLVRRLALVKQAIDLHSNTPGQWVLERFLRTGRYREHLGHVRTEYAARRATMLQALAAAAPPDVSWRTPQGGFYVWCRIPSSVAQGRLLARAAERGVSYLPGAPCFAGEPSGNFVRLNFSYSDRDAIREGVTSLMEAVAECAAAAQDAPRHGVGTPPIV